MSMDKVYQVFVSSTFSDLEGERKAVSDTLAKSGFIPSGMELFPATDQQQLEFIKRIIDRCDYYVVIVGGRYGSLDGDKSFTEKEYEYAVSKKIPILAFIHKDPGKIASEKVDIDPDQVRRLNLFRDRLKASRIVAFWTNVSDLRTEVLTAVTNAVNLSPGTGWIRGDQAIDPKVLQEMERLRIENTELVRRLAALDSEEIRFPADLLGPNDELELTLREYNTGTKQTNEVKVQAELGEIFVNLFDTLLKEPAEFFLGSQIGEVVSKLVDRREKNIRYSIPHVQRLRYHFEALGLIKAIGKVDNSFGEDTTIVWTITEKGRRFVAQSQAIYRPTAS
jgi:hypothetical protein